jgi:hypothetical protein
MPRKRSRSRRRRVPPPGAPTASRRRGTLQQPTSCRVELAQERRKRWYPDCAARNAGVGMRFAPVAVPRPHELVVEAPIRNQLALFHLETRRLHLLNGLAAAIWSQLHEADTIGDVATGIGARFDLDPRPIRRGVEQTIEQLRADGLLRLDDHFAPACARRSGFTRPARPVAAPDSGS